MNISDIVNEYRSRLRGFIRRRVSRIEDAEDILQEVFYRLAEADKLIKPIDEIAAWLFTVTRNRITDYYRKKQPDLLPKYFDEEESEAISGLEGLFTDPDDNPEMLYLRSAVMEELAEALLELPEEQREVFEMTELQGMSFNEIAEKTRVPVNTLISRKHYAIKHLRNRLSDIYKELIID